MHNLLLFLILLLSYYIAWTSHLSSWNIFFLIFKNLFIYLFIIVILCAWEGNAVENYGGSEKISPIGHTNDN